MSGTLSKVETAIGALGRLQASAPVVLGGMVLTGVEVPDRLRVGGRQMLSVHRVAGGGRVIDALGNDPDRLGLAGRFVGPQAQARAQECERMRMGGVPVAFSGAGLSGMVWIAQFSYDYQAKGAICAYRLVLERVDDPVAVSNTDPAALSGLVGNDAGLAASSLGGVVAGLAGVVGQAGTVVGQITPIANLLGAGGAVARVSNALSAVGPLVQTGANVAAIGASVPALAGGLEAAGQGLGSVVSQAGANLEAIVPANAASLGALVQNAGLLSASADAAGYVNRALANVSGLGNGGFSGPVSGV